jgi:hypothetical protein
VNWARYASQAQGMGKIGHKKLITDNVKILKKQLKLAKLTTSTNVTTELPNVVASPTIFTTPMAIKEIHVKHVLVIQAQEVATIKAKFSELKTEKAKLVFLIKLQSKKLELCKEDLQNMMSRERDMIEAL